MIFELIIVQLLLQSIRLFSKTTQHFLFSLANPNFKVTSNHLSVLSVWYIILSLQYNLLKKITFLPNTYGSHFPSMICYFLHFLKPNWQPNVYFISLCDKFSNILDLSWKQVDQNQQKVMIFNILPF